MKSLGLNEKSVRDVCVASLKRLKALIKSSKLHPDLQVMSGGFVQEPLMNVILTDASGDETLAAVQINLTDPLSPNVYIVDAYEDDEFELALQLIDLLKEEALPKPQDNGLWWADKDYYPIRPMYEGEDASLKPKPWCTVVNGVTGEVIKEAKSWTDDRWVVKTLDAIHDEVLEMFKPTASFTSISAAVYALLYTLGLTGEGAQNVSTAWMGLLVTQSRGTASKQHLDMQLSHFREVLNSFSSYPQAKLKLVSGRTSDGKPVYEQIACTVTDLEGHVGVTVEDKPDAVWYYDPDTYELLGIPKYGDARFNVRKLSMARLRDIDAGRV